MRFYFHIINGKQFLDDVGVELVNIEAAKVEAVRYAGSILKDEKPTDMWQGIPWEIWVAQGNLPSAQTVLKLTLTASDERYFEVN